VTLDFDGSVLGTGRYAEGTAVGVASHFPVVTFPELSVV
jgi:hypothetical protein